MRYISSHTKIIYPHIQPRHLHTKPVQQTCHGKQPTIPSHLINTHGLHET